MEGEKRKEKGKREKKRGGKKKKRRREREKRDRSADSAAATAARALARRSGVAHGTRRNRETGQRLDIGTRFSGDREIGRGMILNGLSSTIEKRF